MSSNSSDTSSFIEESWVQWFCNLTGNQMLCEVERSFIEDSFNLFGLKPYIKDYSKALDIILDRCASQEVESEDLSRTATVLYGLIHARYIITAHGLDNMVKITIKSRENNNLLLLLIYTLSFHSIKSLC
jgi:casein kinase II subunit beta